MGGTGFEARVSSVAPVVLTKDINYYQLPTFITGRELDVGNNTVNTKSDFGIQIKILMINTRF